jgi:DNA-binding transcriptional MerR regulator
MAELIPIGRFAHITGLTIKALHIYDSMGLLRPHLIDTASGYRYYHIGQLTQARRIRLLRSIDMPLEAIGAILQAPTPAALEALLHEHQQRISTRIEKDRQALRLLQQLLDHQEADLALTVQIKTLPDQPIAGIRLQVPPPEESRLIPNLIAELEAYTSRLGVRRSETPPLRISHEYSEERVDTEIAVPLTGPIGAEGRITGRILVGGPAAYASHVGPQADLWAVYWVILEWVQAHGYRQGGPPRELYWTPPEEGHSAEYRTEIQWPIQTHEVDRSGLADREIL